MHQSGTGSCLGLAVRSRREVTVGTSDGGASPEQWCRASAPAAAAPQPALLTWPRAAGGGWGRACCSLGSHCPCARRPGEPAAGSTGLAGAGAMDGVGEERAGEALSQRWCIKRLPRPWTQTHSPPDPHPHATPGTALHLTRGPAQPPFPLNHSRRRCPLL